MARQWLGLLWNGWLLRAHVDGGLPQDSGSEFKTVAKLEMSCGGDAESHKANLSARVQVALLGALVGDAVALPGHRRYDTAEVRAAYAHFTASSGSEGGWDFEPVPMPAGSSPPWTHSEYGDELMHALEVVARRGFEFHEFATAWKSWAESYDGIQSPAMWASLHNLAAGTPPEAAGSHWIDLSGAVRTLSLLLLADRVDDEGLALASREAQLFSHENPQALQAGEFILRSALYLVRCLSPPAVATDPRASGAAAFRDAADKVGSQYHAVIDEALAEAQSRDAFAAVAAGHGTSRAAAKLGAFAHKGPFQSDAEIIGRLTASGETPGQEVQGDKTSFAIPAIIWFVLAYDTFHDAALASALLGGESALRGVFVGFLSAARGGSIPAPWLDQLVERPKFASQLPSFVMPLQLCMAPGTCQAGETFAGERRMHGISVAATVIRLEHHGPKPIYRIYVRINGTERLSRSPPKVRPKDWDDGEDGPWEPPDPVEQVSCLARYFQFTTHSGRHAAFGVWPAHAMCQLTLAAPIAHESFDVSLPEPLSRLIGGMVLGSEPLDVKLPILTVDAGAVMPVWGELCDHVGLVELPKGKWYIDE